VNEIIVVVHQGVDLDAVASVQAVRMANPGAVVRVELLGADATELPGWLRDREVRVLDHDLGEKGTVATDGRRHAALLSMPEAEGWDPYLLAEVDEQDSTGRVRSPRFSLPAILAAIKQALREEEGLSGSELDHRVLDAMGLVLRGLVRLHENRQEAVRILDRIPVHQVGRVRVAVLPEGPHIPSLGVLLESRGVDCSVYQSGTALGITRYPGHEEPDLRVLADRLPGWFVHGAGFLACWGSAKAPKAISPPEGTPQDQGQLLDLLREVYEARLGGYRDSAPRGGRGEGP